MTKGGERERLALNIGKTKKLLDAGHSISEITTILGKDESTIRAWVGLIEKAEEKKTKN